MALHEVKIEIPIGAADAANDVLLERGLENWSLLEDVIAKRAWVTGVSADAAGLRAEWGGLRNLLSAAEVSFVGAEVWRELVDSDWRDSYKTHFHAWQFGRLHWVPVWEREKFSLPAGDAVLWLDPGLAFGTGNHETTRLCVERLVGIAETGLRKPDTMRVVDAGCGSGILALSAARLGFRDVSGFDNDPEAVRVSEENAALNHLTSQVTFHLGDLLTGFATGPSDVVLANILGNVLIQFAGELTRAVAPGGTLILSGILAIEVEQVRAAFAAVVPDWPQESRTMGEWSDVMLTRPA